MRSAGEGEDTGTRLSVTDLFDRYLQAREGESGEDPMAVIALAEDPAELARRVATYERLRDGLSREPRLGRFRLIEALGDGGMSAVHLAFDPLLGRNVALKVLAPQVAMDAQRREWMLNEARSLARLEHPGIVRIFEVDRTEDHDYVVMEHLPGPSLREVIAELIRRRNGAQTRPEVERLVPYSARLALLVEIGETLAFCHDHGVIHRDVKPGNVLLDADGHGRLIDFGLAHLDAADEDTSLQITQDLRGTPAYLAPEQVEYGRTGADPKSDQFSFALTAYELLTLAHPFRQETRGATLDAIARTAVPPVRKHDPALPPDLELVLAKGLARDPAERYPDVAALVADLRAVLEHRPVQARAPSPARLARLWLRRNRRAVGTWSAALMSIGALLLTKTYLDLREEYRELGARIEANLAATTSAATPDEFETTLQQWRQLHEQAHALDRSDRAAFTLRTITPQALAGLETWSRHLGKTIREELKASAARDTVFQYLPWFGLVQRDHDLGLSVGNEDLHARGRVEYTGFDPATSVLSLRIQAPISRSMLGTWTHRMVPTAITDYQRPGHYRLEVRSQTDGHLICQTEYRQSEVWGPLQTIECQPLPADLLERTVLIEGGRPFEHLAGADPDDEAARFEVAPFRLSVERVTTAEFEDFLKDSDRQYGYLDRSPEMPAVTTPDGALAYASWRGGRLPTYAELYHALTSEQLAVGEEVLTSHGEYTSDLPKGFELHGCTVLSYTTARKRTVVVNDVPFGVIGRGSRSDTDSDGDARLCFFRLAFPLQ